jgi:taurine dioxygenase
MTGQHATIEVTPLCPAIGADVAGVDLSEDQSAATVAEIESAAAEHLVLRFRGQRLAVDQLERFSERFGPLEKAPINPSGKPWLPDHPNVAVMSNIIENGKPIGSLGAGEAIWHTDMSYIEETPTHALLYAVEIPPVGGKTYWSNMYTAFDELPVELRRKIEGRLCVHDSTYNSAGQIRAGFEAVADPSQAPGAHHPMIRVHPTSGRKCLFLGRRRNAYVVGLPLEESETLLDQIWAHATQGRYAWGNDWRVGDLMMWDNRCAMHRRDAFDADARRYMYRTQLKGERPIAA